MDNVAPHRRRPQTSFLDAVDDVVAAVGRAQSAVRLTPTSGAFVLPSDSPPMSVLAMDATDPVIDGVLYEGGMRAIFATGADGTVTSSFLIRSGSAGGPVQDAQFLVQRLMDHELRVIEDIADDDPEFAAAFVALSVGGALSARGPDGVEAEYDRLLSLVTETPAKDRRQIARRLREASPGPLLPGRHRRSPVTFMSPGEALTYVIVERDRILASLDPAVRAAIPDDPAAIMVHAAKSILSDVGTLMFRGYSTMDPTMSKRRVMAVDLVVLGIHSPSKEPPASPAATPSPDSRLDDLSCHETPIGDVLAESVPATRRRRRHTGEIRRSTRIRRDSK
jgi:hypothetical protein